MDTIALDVETNAKDPRFSASGFKVLGVSYASSRTLSGYVPLGHYGCDDETRHMGMSALSGLVGSHSRFVFHNAKYDLVCLQTLGIDLWDEDWYDTMLMQHMVNENLPNKSLDYLAKLYFDEGKEKSEDFVKFLDSFGWAFLPQSMIEPYAIQDAKLTLRLFELLLPEYEKQYGSLV